MLSEKLNDMLSWAVSDFMNKYDIINEIESEIEKAHTENVDEKISEALPAIKEKERADAVIQVRTEYNIVTGMKIFNLSPFNSESIYVNGNELYPNSFIPDRTVNDPISEDVKLYFDDQNAKWLVRVKNGLPKLISRFVVVACLIVDASGPGVCRAFVVFLKGEAKPLIFWNGIINPTELRKQTQFHQKGLNYGTKDIFYQSFLRALRSCKSIYFLSLPKHAGWNLKPDGLLVFVDSAMMKPEFEGLFLKDDAEDKGKKCNNHKLHNIFHDISLVGTERKFEEVVADYNSLLPDAIPIKIGIVISIMSRLLPHYKAEGLIQDRLWVVETADDATAKTLIAVIQNRDHRTTKALFSSMRLPYIEEEIKKYVDCAAILRHSCTICSMHDFNKMLKYLHELVQNGYGDEGNSRLVPVLLIDSAGIIPEGFQIHQLPITEQIKVENLEQFQKLLGELDYLIVKLVERNPDTVQQRIKAMVAIARDKVSTLPRSSQSSSAVMFLSTALMLTEGTLFTDADIQTMLQWLRTEARSRTSMSRSVCKIVGAALSDAICNGSLQITKQYGSPFWTADSAFVAVNDSINVTKDTLDDIFTDISVGRNTALQYLQDEDVLFKDKDSKGGQKTWTVETEDGVKKPRRFYSFSRDLLTPEANRIVDETVASDLFHKPDKHINHFFPFIKHTRLDMFAGQVITDYKHGSPFIAVTGSQGSGKTTLMMLQVLLRAEADDLVVVIDPTNSFCREELMAHGIPIGIINKSFSFWNMSTQGWPVNILDFEGCKDMTQRIQRLSSLLISGMHLTGPNQKAILITKVENGSRNMRKITSLAFTTFRQDLMGMLMSASLK